METGEIMSEIYQSFLSYICHVQCVMLIRLLLLFFVVFFGGVGGHILACYTV